MLQLRIKIDSWSNGVLEHIRERNRELLADAYMQLPPGRVWHYCQQIEIMHLSHGELDRSRKTVDIGQIVRDAPENVMAEGKRRNASERNPRRGKCDKPASSIINNGH